MLRKKQGSLKFEKDDLMRILQALGAKDPVGWADSQLEEGIPQLARFLFLRSAWQLVLRDADIEWIDRAIEETPADSDDPFAGTSHSLRRLLAAGADRLDLTELVRNMQAEVLFGICYLLDDPLAHADDWPEDVAELLGDFGWALVETSESGVPLHEIWALHESVLETDPSGREMRPSISGPV